MISVEDALTKEMTESKISVKRPIAKRAGRSVSECSSAVIQPQNIQYVLNSKKISLEQQLYLDTVNINGKAGISKLIYFFCKL